MKGPALKNIRMAGLIASIVAFLGSIALFPHIAPGSGGRTAMLLVAITSMASGVSFFLQLRQKQKKQEDK